MAASFEETLKKISDRGERMDFIDDALCPPEPQLLDTCVLQNLDWIDRQLKEKHHVVWDEAAMHELSTVYGVDMANDLVDLGIMYKQFEYFGSYPWLVCKVNSSEASLSRGDKGSGLRDIIGFFGGHQDDLVNDAFPGVAIGLLGEPGSSRISPLIMKGLGVKSVEQIFSIGGPLSFLPDDGDRRIAGCALLANIPVILTTDRKTFWKHRNLLMDFGVEIMRPSQLLALYEPYWAALSDEFERRRNEADSSPRGLAPTKKA
jgi:hypothetical protein